MHDRVGDRLAQGLHRVLGDVLAAQGLDAPSGARVAFDEAHGVLDVGHDTAVEVLAIEDVHLVGALGQEAGDVGLVEEVPDVLGEEEDTRVAEEKPPAGALRSFDVRQNVLRAGPAADTAQAQPRQVLRPVESWG